MIATTLDADVLIIGGGLAGLTAGIHLAQQGLRVTLFEKQPYPQHKVCGEYVSNEVLPYLQQLGVCIDELHPSRLNRFLFSTVTGATLTSDLPLGGFGISRFVLDALLYRKAVASGVDVIQKQVDDILFADDTFTITTSDGKLYHSPIVIGAYGKRSVLDKRLNRGFSQKTSPWVGVKAHYQADFPADLVALHNFDGGYCGLCQVENNVVNACYLASYSSFKPYKNVDAFQRHVLNRNPFLQNFFATATPLFNKPLSISQISFAKRQPVEKHVLMCGDTAGVIHPLCGNGMAMAIHSAKLAAELILTFFTVTNRNRAMLEEEYTNFWNRIFKKRLATGRIVQSMLQRPLLASVLLQGLQLTPSLLPVLIKQTHGKPLATNHLG